MQSNNKVGRRWGWLLGLLSMALLAGACSQGPTEIGVGLPDANANTGAYLLDTVTVRTSTVLRDSVVTSNSSYLVAGRYLDPLLGTITAKSYVQVAPNALFTPDVSYVYDSVALVLNFTSGDRFRYGDTTKTQTLFAVYPMTAPIPNTKVSFSSPRLTKLSYDSTQLLNANLTPRRARPNLTSLRIRLRDDFGRKLLAAGQAGSVRTVEDFTNYLPGLAIVPGATDNATIVRFNAASSDAGIFLYYHAPTDATTSMNAAFPITSGTAHCFQVTADRSTAAVNNLPMQSLQQVFSARTGERTFVEGAIGLQTRLEFPYLTNVRQLGQHLTVTSATLTAQVPAPTLTPGIPTPPTLALKLSNINNQPTSTTNYTSASYATGVSTLTGLDQGSYTWLLTTYIQNVLNNTQANNGFLISSDTPDQPTRVALASQRDPLNKLQLRIYLISLQ